MTIQIADTSRGVFFFCDQATADAIVQQVGYGDINGEHVLPSCIYVIVLPDAAEVVPLETAGPLPAIEPDQEALREAVSRIRGR